MLLRYIGTIKTTVEVVKPRSEHTSSSSVIQPTPRPTHPTHMSTRFRLHNIQWSPDEVSDVFAVPLSDLFDPTRIHTQLFRGHSDLPVPSWHGPPVSDSIAKSMHELPREHPHHAGAWKKEPAAVRPPVEPSLSLSNIVVDPQTQVAHYRIWGLTAYVLGRFLRKCIVPMVVHAGKPYPAEALVAGPKAGNVMGKDTTDGKSASDEYDTKRK